MPILGGQWTHPICNGCWWRSGRDRVPHRLTSPTMEHCCFCGGPTLSGAYVRAAPDKTPCRGQHPFTLRN